MCTWESDWRSEEQEGTGIHSHHWAGHSVHRHLQLMAGGGGERHNIGMLTGHARSSCLPIMRFHQLNLLKNLSLLLCGHLSAQYSVLYSYAYSVLTVLRGKCCVPD